MAAEAHHGEDLGAGLLRVVRKHLGEAVDTLHQLDLASPHAAVHRARGRLRMCRSLLKLGAPGWQRDDVAAVNAFFRDAARELAPARDVHVMGVTLSTVAEGLGDGLDEVRERLDLELARVARDLVSRHTVPALVRLLRETRAAAESWPAVKPSAVWEGLRLTYRRVRLARDAAVDTESRHEWRKRVKDFRFQLKFLQPAAPDVLGPLEQGLHALSDTLGEEHDLAVLEAWVGPGTSAPPALFERIHARRAALQERAAAAGGLLLAERPRDLAERIERLHHAWTAGSRPA